MTESTLTEVEAKWLFRILFGREVEGPETISWLQESYADFETARKSLMLSDEFSIKYGHLVGVEARSTALPSAALAKKFVDLYASIQFSTLEVEQRLHLDADDKLLIETMIEKSNVGVIVTHGSLRARVLAFELALRSRTDCVIILNIPIVDQTITPLPREYFQEKEGKFVFFDVNYSLSDLLGRLAVDKLHMDVFINDNDLISLADMAAIEVMLAMNSGTFFDVSSSRVLENLCKSINLDLIKSSNFALLARGPWPLPIQITNRPTSNPKNRDILAVAAIMKNESHNISKMLERCIPYCSFISIVDTGSADNSVFIARNILEKSGIDYVIKEIEFSDFAAARNFALDQVPTSMTWTLMLDADEYIEEADYDLLGTLLDGEHDAYLIPRYNYRDLAREKEPFSYPDRQGRLIRNKSSNPIRYRGRVHEVLTNVTSWGMPPLNTVALDGAAGGPHIHHMGYADISPERFAEKDALYRSLQRT